MPSRMEICVDDDDCSPAAKRGRSNSRRILSRLQQSEIGPPVVYPYKCDTLVAFLSFLFLLVSPTAA